MVIHLPSKARGMKKGFTLIELMVAIAMIGVFIALLLPNIQNAKDTSLSGTQKSGPYWVYREYEYAGGPAITEISGSYQHSLQEILDMYVINLKKDQLKNLKKLESEVQQELITQKETALHTEAVLSTDSSTKQAGTNSSVVTKEPKISKLKEEQIKKAKFAIMNLRKDLTQNYATLSARRNIYSAIDELYEDIRLLKSRP